MTEQIIFITGHDYMVWRKSIREFLYVDDTAEVSIVVMNLNNGIYQQETGPILCLINIWTSIYRTKQELLEMVENWLVVAVKWFLIDLNPIVVCGKYRCIKVS